MTKLLSEEKIDDIEHVTYCKTLRKGKTQHVYLTQFARAIEAAVLEELAKQKPAYTFHLDSTGAAYLRGECVSKEGDPLYAAPVVQPQQEPVGKPHRWNDDGERCLDCGDKDWMADKYCSAAPVVQEKQEPVAWMHWYKYYDGTVVVKVAIGHAPTFNDQSPFRSEPLYAAPVVQPEIEAKYNELLYAVANRYPCETRHETALRYLRAHEKSDGAAMAAEKEQT